MPVSERTRGLSCVPIRMEGGRPLGSNSGVATGMRVPHATWPFERARGVIPALLTWNSTAREWAALSRALASVGLSNRMPQGGAAADNLDLSEVVVHVFTRGQASSRPALHHAREPIRPTIPRLGFPNKKRSSPGTRSTSKALAWTPGARARPGFAGPEEFAVTPIWKTGAAPQRLSRCLGIRRGPVGPRVASAD